jgi:hypothetical protein
MAATKKLTSGQKAAQTRKRRASAAKGSGNAQAPGNRRQGRGHA